MSTSAEQFGRFQVVERLASRPGREVYRAVDSILGRSVVLKALDTAEAPWLDEARAAAAVQHPHVATLHDVIRSEGQVVLAFEDVGGRSLESELADGPLPILDAARLARDLASGLAAIHRAGWHHGDVKDANVAVTDDGAAKLLDFGLAGRRLAGDGDGETGAGLSGTPGFMAPEQLRGLGSDARSDVFGLGVVLFRMLHGQYPFDGEDRAAQVRATLDGLPPLHRDGVPLELETLTRHLLNAEPTSRPTADDVVDRLDRLIDRLESATPSQTPDEEASRATGFRGLAPFVEADRHLFFGRDAERRALIEKLEHQRFVVLYGESGSGKTSLLRAGLVPALRRNGAVAIYARPVRDPISSLGEAIARQHGTLDEAEEPVMLIEHLAEDSEAEVVLIFDQFEELFVQVEPDPREAFLDLLGSLHDLGRIRVLIALRRDFLYVLAEALQGRVDDPLANRHLFALHHLGVGQVEDIIRRALGGDAVDEALISTLTTDLLGDDERVLATELQIVGEQLERHGATTLDAYRRLGGREALVGSYLADVVAASSRPKRLRLLLHTLVSDDLTRATLSIPELAEKLGRKEASLAPLIEELVAARLVHEVQDREPWRYELQHEALVPQIERLAARDLDDQQHARRALNRYLAEAAADKNSHIPLRQLERIRRHLPGRRTAAEAALIRRSWRLGLLRVATLLVLGTALVLGIAAMSSIEEQWRGSRLSDGHPSAVRKVLASPDGRLFTGGDDGQVMVWDPDHVIEKVLAGSPDEFVTALALSSDGERLASGHGDGTVKIFKTGTWDQETELQALDGSRDDTAGQSVTAILFFGSDRRLLTVTKYRTSYWESDNWTLAGDLPFGSSHSDVLLSPSGSSIYFPREGWWNPDSAGFLSPVPSLAENDVAWDPTRSLTISIDHRGMVRLARWRTSGQPEDGVGIELLKQLAHQDSGRAVAVHHSRGWAASGSDDIALWDLSDPRLVGRLPWPAIVWDLDVTNESRLVSSYSDGAIVSWDVDDLRAAVNLSGHANAVRDLGFSKDGNLLASVGEDRVAVVWDLERRRKIAVFDDHPIALRSLALLEDQKTLVVLTKDAELFWWDFEGRVLRHRVSFQNAANTASSLAIDSDSADRWIVTGLSVHDAKTGKLLKDIPKRMRPGGVSDVQYSPTSNCFFFSTSNRLSSACPDPWRVTDHLRHTPPAGHVFNHLAVSPDGRRLVTGSSDGSVLLWTGPPFWPEDLLGRHKAWVNNVVFHPDSCRLASASDDLTVRLWDVCRKRFIATIGTFTSPPLSLAFSPDGRLLAVGTQDGSIRIYEWQRWLWGRRLE